MPDIRQRHDAEMYSTISQTGKPSAMEASLGVLARVDFANLAKFEAR